MTDYITECTDELCVICEEVHKGNKCLLRVVAEVNSGTVLGYPKVDFYYWAQPPHFEAELKEKSGNEYYDEFDVGANFVKVTVNFPNGSRSITANCGCSGAT